LEYIFITIAETTSSRFKIAVYSTVKPALQNSDFPTLRTSVTLTYSPTGGC
jgi:hypothetical protein